MDGLLEDRCRLIGGNGRSRSSLWEEERHLEELVDKYREENDFLRCRLDAAEEKLSAARLLLDLPAPACAEEAADRERAENAGSL